MHFEKDDRSTTAELAAIPLLAASWRTTLACRLEQNISPDPFAFFINSRTHEGFDGVMLGQKGAAYHLEFTSKKGHHVGKAPTDDNLLVFYLPDHAEWKNAVDKLAAQGVNPVRSFNPYWDKNGKTFADPDGYRVVLQNAKWPA